MKFCSFLRKKKKSIDSAESAESSNSPHLQLSRIAFRELINPQTHIEELKQVFQKFDADGDGKISASELGATLSSTGFVATEDELKQMINAVDVDRDGYINLNEFIALNTEEIDSEEFMLILKDAFLDYDLDRNGLISAEELQIKLRSLGDEYSIAQCKKMIDGVDSDGDGMIDFKDFKAMMKGRFCGSL